MNSHRSFRDRRGRGVRGVLAWPRVPAMVSRSEAFDGYVLDAVERIERHLGRRLGPLEVAVELVPPSDPTPWESPGTPLSRYFPAERDSPARLVLYRKPIEFKVDDPEDTAAAVDKVVVEQVAGALGVDPSALDPGYDAGDE